MTGGSNARSPFTTTGDDGTSLVPNDDARMAPSQLLMSDVAVETRRPEITDVVGYAG